MSELTDWWVRNFQDPYVKGITKSEQQGRGGLGSPVSAGLEMIYSGLQSSKDAVGENLTNWWHNQVIGREGASEDPDAMTSSDEEIKTMTQAEEVSTGASKGGAYGGISQASSAAYLTAKRRGAAPQPLLTAGKSGARATVQRRTAV